ncbi:MAG TPA: AMP-binding protein [Acidimicrobiales bacterium]|nr:AMP-binding protein [Acidimicrobiales bacterium]
MTTMIGPLRRATQIAARQPAIACGDIELTYAETLERCRRLVGGLRALGVREGERVAIVAANCHRYVELYQAVPGAGMVLVPLNQRHTDGELNYALADSETKVLFTNRAVDGLPACVEHVIDLEDGYEKLLAEAGPADFPDDLPDTTLAGLFYTGGTTGASKGVMLTHRNLIANALHYQSFYPFRPEMCWLIAAPLFHAAGSIAVLPTVWQGGRQVVLPAFDPAVALDLIERHGVTGTLLVPTMLAALNEEQLARPRDVVSMKAIFHGGSPVATETLRRAHVAFPTTELLEMYGATETAPIATSFRGEELVLDSPRARSCGQPAVGVEIRIIDSDGSEVPTGQVGEVSIRGDNVMAGYWNKPEQTAAALVGGWYRSGDLGYVDGEGFVYLVDRAKDMIVSGGENVYSVEVEDVLYRHPAVLEAAVFGVPDAQWGEAVHAVVIPRSDITERELLEHCRASIAGYKVPKHIELRTDPLPKSGAGKVLKRELREPYWEGVESRVGGT